LLTAQALKFMPRFSDGAEMRPSGWARSPRLVQVDFLRSI
jgi:hypothetical protein